MEIRKVRPEEFQKARAFYYAVIDGIDDCSTSVKWQKDVYPDPRLIENSICREEFFAGEFRHAIGTKVLTPLSAS